MVAEKPAQRWRKPAIALFVFVLVSLGIGPKVVDHYFRDAADTVADRLGSVEVEVAPLPDDADPLFNQPWVFAGASALGAAAVPKAQADATVRRDGVPLGAMIRRFVVRSNRANDLVITQMRARVVRKAEPMAGTLVLPVFGGGPTPDPIVSARFVVNGPDPRAYDGLEPDRLLFGDKTLVLKRDETMILQVDATVLNCYCEWVVDVELLLGTDLRTVTVPDVAHPLRMTSPVPRYQSVYQTPGTAGAEVVPVDPAQACQGDCVANPLTRQGR